MNKVNLCAQITVELFCISISVVPLYNTKITSCFWRICTGELFDRWMVVEMEGQYKEMDG